MSFYSSTISCSQFAGVPQGGFAVTRYEKSNLTIPPILFTSQVLSCITITFYSPKQKLGALAHLDASCLVVDFFEKIHRIFEKHAISFQEMQVSLIGGWQEDRSSQHLKEKIIGQLKKRSWIFNDLTFKKSLLNAEQIQKINQLRSKLNQLPINSTYNQEHLRALDELFEIGGYSQILLDTNTGKVCTTSQYIFNQVPSFDHTAYSKKAKLIKRETDQLCEKYAHLDSQDLPSDEGIQRKVKKVYDATSSPEKYFPRGKFLAQRPSSTYCYNQFFLNRSSNGVK